MDAGDTFFAPLPPNNDSHLFVIISNPSLDDAHVVIVPFMTIDSDNNEQELTCKLEKGDHPFVRHPTFINYDCAKAPSMEKIIATSTGNGKKVELELLRRIREGARDSELIALRFLGILEKQGLI